MVKCGVSAEGGNHNKLREMVRRNAKRPPRVLPAIAPRVQPPDKEPTTPSEPPEEKPITWATLNEYWMRPGFATVFGDLIRDVQAHMDVNTPFDDAANQLAERHGIVRSCLDIPHNTGDLNFNTANPLTRLYNFLRIRETWHHAALRQQKCIDHEEKEEPSEQAIPPAIPSPQKKEITKKVPTRQSLPKPSPTASQAVLAKNPHAVTIPDTPERRREATTAYREKVESQKTEDEKYFDKILKQGERFFGDPSFRTRITKVLDHISALCENRIKSSEVTLPGGFVRQLDIIKPKAKVMRIEIHIPADGDHQCDQIHKDSAKAVVYHVEQNLPQYAEIILDSYADSNYTQVEFFFSQNKKKSRVMKVRRVYPPDKPKTAVTVSSA